jgi:hypothetical protein
MLGLVQLGKRINKSALGGCFDGIQCLLNFQVYQEVYRTGIDSEISVSGSFASSGLTP